MATTTFPPLVKPPVHRWTQDQYHQMDDLGWFIEKRVELIDGVVFERNRLSPLECMGIALTSQALDGVFGPNYWVRNQADLDFGVNSEPIPDLAVISGTPRQCKATPTTALLVVEISESTLAYDRGYKSSLYAANRISDYWIVNFVDNQLEVFRHPVADPNQPFGFRYDQRTIHIAGQLVVPLAAPGATITVADLLP